MSAQEKKVWLWLLSASGLGALLSAILPASLLILLMYMLIGILLLFCLSLFTYVLATFLINLALVGVGLKNVWVRLGISSLVVVVVASQIGALLNGFHKTEYDKLAAHEVPLTAHPILTRLVLIDDRSATQSAGWDVYDACHMACKSYLYNKQVRAVLFPFDAGDMNTIEARTYAIFTARSDCEHIGNKNEISALVSSGDCLGNVLEGSLEPGDLIVRRSDLAIHKQHLSDNELIEVYLVTSSGLKLLSRTGNFKISTIPALPIFGRDIGATGSSTYDHGYKFLSGEMSHGHSYDQTMEDDLGLKPDIRIEVEKKAQSYNGAQSSIGLPSN